MRNNQTIALIPQRNNTAIPHFLNHYWNNNPEGNIVRRHSRSGWRNALPSSRVTHSLAMASGRIMF